MKIFLDTANVATIAQWASSGLIDGVTTNPTHLSKENKAPRAVIEEIVALLPEGEISVEVTEQAPEAVYQQAQKIARIAENIVVKIPCASQYYSVINRLLDEGICINITLVFSVTQALMMAKLGVAMISPFLGRLDDIDAHGLQTIENIRAMLDTYEYETELLAASVRSVEDISKLMNIGVDSITLPIEVFEKSLDHPLTSKGMELFGSDWKKLGISQFP